MGLYKEANYFLENLAKYQSKLPNGSYGIPVKSHTDPICKKVKEALNTKFLFGSLKQHRFEKRYADNIHVTISVYLPWEQLGKNAFNCSKWDIIYKKEAKLQYLQFIHKRIRVPKSVVWCDDTKPEGTNKTP